MSGTVELLADGPVRGPRVVLAHGAGAPMESDFMNAVARGLAGLGLRVLRFEFPYMREGRKIPDRAPVLLDTWRAVLGQIGRPERMVIGGKSMGGRMASLIADEVGARGLLCFGFPFHAPGKPPGDRIGHLATLATPTLILQGTRDPFGTRAEVASYTLAPAIRIHWLDDGDHDLEPRRASGRTGADHLDEACAVSARFVRARAAGSPTSAPG